MRLMFQLRRSLLNWFRMALHPTFERSHKAGNFDLIASNTSGRTGVAALWSR
jgi:hypothetical protein